MTGEGIAGYAEAFRRDGFVHVPGVLTSDEIARYGAAVDEAVATRKAGDTRRLDEKSPYEQSFLQCQYVWEDFPGIRPLTLHPRIGELAAAGRAILMISSELPELLALCDRVLVMAEGRLTANIARADASQESIMQAAVPRSTVAA